MTRLFRDLSVTLPVGDFDDSAPFDVVGHVTLRGDTFDVNIVSATDPWGNVTRGAGLSGRHAEIIENALCDAFEAAERRARAVADEVRAVALAGVGR